MKERSGGSIINLEQATNAQCVARGPDERYRAQVQSYVSRVRFVEACTAIPADALLLEIGPHALLRSPLRQNRATLPCAPARTPTPLFIVKQSRSAHEPAC